MTPRRKSATHRTHADAERHPPSLRYSQEVSGRSDRSVQHSAQKLLVGFRRCREGAPGLVWRPGPRPAPLGRPGHISGVPSRPKHPAQPLALDVGSPRAAQVTGVHTGKGYFFASVTGSPHPTGPACSYDPCASKLVSVAFASCAVRERQVARPVSRRRAARPTGLPIARNCGAL